MFKEITLINYAMPLAARLKARKAHGAVKVYAPACRQSDDPHLWGFNSEDCDDALRFVGKVDADGRQTSRDDLGWLTDPYGDVFKDGTGICQGVVYQLAGRRGRARYVAGYQFGGMDGGPTLDLSTIYDAPGDDHDAGINEASYAANQMAERAAEAEREYQTAWQAGSRFASLNHEADELRKEICTLTAEFRQARQSVKGFEFEALCRTVINRSNQERTHVVRNA